MPATNLQPAAPWELAIPSDPRPYGTKYKPRRLKAPLWWRITRTSFVIGFGTFLMFLLTVPLAFG